MAELKNVVLLGIGHTNAHVVHQWAARPLPGCRLVCVSRFPVSTYSGMLPGTLGKQFSPDEMQIPLAPLVQRSGGELICADVTGIDHGRRQLLFENHDPLAFDVLSVGVGSLPAGWEMQSSPISVPIKPMQTFLSRLDQRLHIAVARSPSVLRVAVVGGGVAGVETALCLQQRLRLARGSEAATIELFTGGPRPADGMRPASVQRIESLLRSRGITLHAGKRVQSVSSDHLTTEDGSQHSADCAIWATGATAPPVLAVLGLQTDEHGFIATKNTLQSLSDPRVFAVGDAGTIIETPCPKAGVYAVRQSPILWHNLCALMTGEPLKRFRPQRDFLKLLNTGDGKALLEYKALTIHARWCWHLKTWIDKRFVARYRLKVTDRQQT